MKKLLLFGDSLLADLSDIDFGQDFKITNLCEPGATLCDLESMEEKQIGLSFYLKEDIYDGLILCIGTNDFAHNQLRPDEICDKIINLVKHKNADLITIILGFPYEKKASKQLCNLIENTKMKNVSYLSFVDLEKRTEYVCEDGIHLNRKGEIFMVSKIQKAFKEKTRKC